MYSPALRVLATRRVIEKTLTTTGLAEAQFEVDVSERETIVRLNGATREDARGPLRGRKDHRGHLSQGAHCAGQQIRALIVAALAAKQASLSRLSSAVEQRFCKPKVGGSIPSAGTSKGS
jgi:hypothetical protein